MRGQTSMITIAIAIVMIVFIMIFLLTSSLVPQQSQTLKSEYRNLYAHNMLLSMLRMETRCGSISDVLKGAYFGGGKCDSMPFLEARLPGYINSVLYATGNTEYEWFFEATPKDFQGSVLGFGNPAVKDSMEKWDARTMITWEDYQLDVKIYIRTK